MLLLGMIAIAGFLLLSGPSWGASPETVRVPPGASFKEPVEPPGLTLAEAVRAAGGRTPDAWKYVSLSNPNVGPGLVPDASADGLVDRAVYVLQFNDVRIGEYGPDAGTTSDSLRPSLTQVYVDAATGEVLYVLALTDP